MLTHGSEEGVEVEVDVEVGCVCVDYFVCRVNEEKRSVTFFEWSRTFWQKKENLGRRAGYCCCCCYSIARVSMRQHSWAPPQSNS